MTTSDPVVERVARALARHDNPKHENWWPSYESRARAAIAAMSPPPADTKPRADLESSEVSPPPVDSGVVEALDAGALDALRYVLNWADSNTRVSTVMRTFTLPDKTTTREKLERLYAALAKGKQP